MSKIVLYFFDTTYEVDKYAREHNLNYIGMYLPARPCFKKKSVLISYDDNSKAIYNGWHFKTKEEAIKKRKEILEEFPLETLVYFPVRDGYILFSADIPYTTKIEY